MTQEHQQDDVIPHGEQIVERFGGIRPMASKLNVPVTTVQGWKKRDAIPAVRRDEILSAAENHDIDLKGLVTPANENNMRSGIAEDPALLAATAAAARTATAATPQQPHPQQSRPQQSRNETRAQPQGHAMNLDLQLVRKTARRTSLFTTTALLVIVGAVGVLLFGGSNGPSVSVDGSRVKSLEGRVATLETGARSNTGDVADNGGMLAGLQKSVDDLTTVIGSSRDTLAQMADNIGVGTGMPLAQRLSMLEQHILSGSAGTMSSAGVAPVLEALPNMGAMPGNGGDWQAAIADLRNVVSGLQGRTDNLDSALAQAQTENDALGRTLEDVSARDLEAAAMLLTLSQLRQSINRETPIADDLELLRAVAGDNADPALLESIDRMTPYAESGVLTPQGLKRELQFAANDIVTAKLTGEDVSMKDKIMGRLQNLFTVKKDGVSVTGGEEQDLIAKASAQLDAGDVQGAMNTLNQLQGPARQAASPWQGQAAATLAAQGLDSSIVTTLMNKLQAAAASATVTSRSGLSGVVNAGPINMSPVAPVPEDPVLVGPEPELVPQSPQDTSQGVMPEVIQQ